jgi:hypothetical protein
MINENLLEKFQSGILTDQEILASDIAVKRAEIESEAYARAQSEAARRAAIKQRQNNIESLVSIDQTTEIHRRDFERIRFEQRKLNEEFDRLAQNSLDGWAQSGTLFREKFTETIPGVQYFNGAEWREKEDIRKQIEILKTELRERGARLQASCYNVSGIGNSPIEIRDLPPLQFDDDAVEPDEKAA